MAVDSGECGCATHSVPGGCAIEGTHALTRPTARKRGRRAFSQRTPRARAAHCGEWPLTVEAAAAGLGLCRAVASPRVRAPGDDRCRRCWRRLHSRLRARHVPPWPGDLEAAPGGLGRRAATALLRVRARRATYTGRSTTLSGRVTALAIAPDCDRGGARCSSAPPAAASGRRRTRWRSRLTESHRTTAFLRTRS